MLLINIDIIDIFSKNINIYWYVFLPIFPITNFYYYRMGHLIFEFESSIKKKTSGYFFKSMVLLERMKHSIIQMTAIFLRKWARSRRYGQWRVLPYHAQRIFVSKNWREWHERLLVSIGRGQLPYSQRNNRSFVHRFRKSNNQPSFWCQLTASELWFDPVGAIKDKCYANHPETIEALKHEIKVAIKQILFYLLVSS